MSPERTALCYGVAVATGLMAWLGLLIIAGIASGDVPRALRREAWDVELYWVMSLPLSYLMAGVLGWLGPVRIWRWPLVIIGTQLLCAVVLTRSGPSLLPLAVIFMLVLALPALLAAWLGRTLRCIFRGLAEPR